jgi:Skp family chaperone for outer membrane proteins
VEIDTLQRRLQSPPQTGEDRDRLQVQLAKLQTELRLFVERERATVQKRELGLQVELYKQVREVVAKLAKQRGLKLVFVRPELSVDSQNPLEAGRAINGLLLYEEEGLEITDDVLTALAERATSTSASPSPATSEPVTSNPATAQPAKAK